MTDPHDPIEAALSEPAYLDDGKFTDGVMAALPPRQPRRRGAVLLAAGVAAVLLGAATLGEPLAAALLALGTAGAAGVLLLRAPLEAVAGARRRGARHHRAHPAPAGPPGTGCGVAVESQHVVH